MTYYDLYFQGNRAVIEKMERIAFRYDHVDEDEDKRPPSVLYIPFSNFESRCCGGETSRALFEIVDSIKLRNPGKTSIRKQGLALLRSNDYTPSGIEEPIRKLLDEAVAELWNKREEMLGAECSDSMSDDEIARLFDKYPMYAPCLKSEYDDFLETVLKTKALRGYNNTITFDQMLEVVCHHVDGDKLRLLPDGRNVFVVRQTRRLRNHLLYTKPRLVHFAVTFNPSTNRWWIEEESIADIKQDRFKGKVTRLFWQGLKY